MEGLMIKNYLKTAWRNLGKSKMHSFINITGLSIGMAVATLIGLWMFDELSFDKNFKNYHRIAQVIQNVTNNGEVQTWRGVPYPLADELRKNYGSDFKYVVMGTTGGDHLLAFDEKKLNQNGIFFEKEAPELLSLNIQRGSGSLDDPASILLSSSTAKAYFGEEDPVNKLMKIDNYPPVKITGVYKDFPHNSTFADLKFISTWDFFFTNNDIKSMQEPWRPNFTSLYVQLNDHADFGKVSERIRDAKLKKVNSQLQKKKPALFLHPMSEWHLYSEFKNGVNVGGAIQYVWMFGIIGAFVLLLACINFMNLNTARSEKRAKEVGIRKTVGSLRSQLIQQFFAESIFTAALAFALSALWVQLSLSLFNQIAGKQMAIPWAHPLFWLLSIGFTLFTALIAGSYPAFYLSSFNAVKVLKGTFKAGRLAAIPRKVLVVVQFTVSVTLIIGTIVVYRQIQFAKNRPVGYSRAGLINVPTPDSSIHQHFDAIRNELMQSGAISSIAESGAPTTTLWGSSSGFSWKGKDPNLSIDFGTARVTYDYGKTIGWHIKEGRDFSKDFLTDSSAIILNESAARFMGLQHPVGETIMWFDKPYSVIGVINDMLMESPYEMVRPIVYYSSREPGNLVIIKMNPGTSAKDALSKIEPVFKRFDPAQPFEYQFVDSEYAKKFGDEERIGRLASLFSILAIVISCLGLFGLTSFVAEQRKKEIGIRKVLGASAFSVWNLLSRDFLGLVSFSILIAVPLAWYAMRRWLEDYPYRITIGWGIFLIAGVIAISIALVTISAQAIQAAVAKPAKSLRTE
jgi:ABC-type antimicrobial peptide transport system permease subunit